MKKDSYTIEDLIDVMKRLRDPDNGCPWDIEQDFKTIAPHTIEEAYEVADAIDRDDMENLREELGDLLFQSVYHAQMASEDNYFTIHDVIHSVTDKMISRHPHVFGNINADTPADVKKIWEQKKEQEKQSTQDNKLKSALNDVPLALPALLRAQKLQRKAAKTGFTWPDVHSALDKIEEELRELKQAVQSGTKEQQTDEIGDVLLTVANLARMLGINAEEAARQANQKFERRFKNLEQYYKDQGVNMNTAPLEELLKAWEVLKQ